METSDAIYAAAIDRLQPLLNNYVTKGHTWQRGVTYDQVYERMEMIEKASPELWQVVNDILNRSVELGYLKKL